MIRPRDSRWLLGADLIAAAIFLVVVLLLALFSPRGVRFWHASVMLPVVATGLLLLVALVQTLLAPQPSLRRLGRQSLLLVGDWVPLIIAVLAYENMHDLTYLRPKVVDSTLRLLDERLFGITPALAFDRITTPWLTEIMSAAYALYFVYPAVLLLLLYRRGDLACFREVGLALGLCLYVGLLGYVIVPAVGPRYTMAAEFSRPLVGPWLTSAAANVWNRIELVDRDCFPSLHTALTLLSLVYFVRLRRVLPYGRALVALVTPPIVLLWASTLYLRYHYGVDVIAGAVLAFAVASAAPWLASFYRELIMVPWVPRAIAAPLWERAILRWRHRRAGRDAIVVRARAVAAASRSTNSGSSRGRRVARRDAGGAP
jgi:membrane-associated phospholipid phosphatase